MDLVLSGWEFMSFPSRRTAIIDGGGAKNSILRSSIGCMLSVVLGNGSVRIGR